MSRTKETPSSITQEIFLDTSDINRNVPIIRPEDFFGKGVGRFSTPLRCLSSWSSNPIFDKYLNKLNAPQNDQHRKSDKEKLSRDLHGNSIEKLIRIPEHSQAVSVFYTLNPKERMFFMEWGKIDPESKEMKLHTSIRRVVDYNKRVREGMQVYSGHIAHINKTPHFFSLIDSVSSLPSQKMSADEKKLIDMLYNINFFPLTTDGQMVLPQFI